MGHFPECRACGQVMVGTVAMEQLSMGMPRVLPIRCPFCRTLDSYGSGAVWVQALEPEREEHACAPLP